MKKNIHVVGAIIIERGKILCAQRGPNKTLPYMWEFPGGKIEKGETAEQALKREIKEEIKCKVDVREKFAYTIHEYEFGIVHLITYICKLITGEPELTEHLQTKWLKKEELSSLDWAPADIPTIEKLINKY
ncbi:(deoxy)nucleoside triphosphate pyrophosphohydrolase [Oceanobacillus senegalensis]|uniref:(deoxy)nucleoside triphosphate pyrophosphohydrolase n=1 Tax=Oceanobacillus senegalensis TaxID=1936063 RepID=UPI000A30F445|nr:(deoxy)nucleoside triphosphate pyrophosphohydrolase [Oceanobacillus senegalensis]